MSSSLDGAAAAPDAGARSKKPVTLLVIGMAGSGKTTLMQRLGAHFDELPDEQRDAAYFINLDPAVGGGELPYFANIDIRDTVKYKEVMKQYGLGPNGGIVTSLNLFATRFDQVLAHAEKKRDSLDYVFVDTPGQIEVFTWSASGAIITEALAATFPTAILYVVDTPRNLSPVTFMSNMMYACSIMFKTKLPFLLVFNKTDVASAAPLQEWMRDLDAFLDAIREHDSYMSSLSRSMALVLDEFYRAIKTVALSAVTGDGLAELFTAIDGLAEDYHEVYLPFIEKKRAAREAADDVLKKERASTMRADTAAADAVARKAEAARRRAQKGGDDGDEEEEEVNDE